jgi:4'-phosphopantetheinyl transferase
VLYDRPLGRPVDAVGATQHNGRMRWLGVDEADVPPGDGWLSPREVERLDTIRFTKRRTEYLLRRWAGKRATAAALGASSAPDLLASVELLNHWSGAPYVQIDGRRAALDISLSDRAGVAVALISPPGTQASGTLGIDLEIVEPRTKGFVTDFLTEPEQAYVVARRETHGPDGWDAAANLLWSAKEAALKVLRVGLRADTRTVEVTIDHQVRSDGWGPMHVVHRDGTVFPGWWRRDGAFLLTIAYRQPHEPPELMPGGVLLANAIPTHSWLHRPTT